MMSWNILFPRLSQIRLAEFKQARITGLLNAITVRFDTQRDNIIALHLPATTQEKRLREIDEKGLKKNLESKCLERQWNLPLRIHMILGLNARSAIGF
jgi:hypothetical protein